MLGYKIKSLVKSTAKNSIFNEFFETFVIIQILRYFKGIQGILKKIIPIYSKQSFLYIQRIEVDQIFQ